MPIDLFLRPLVSRTNRDGVADFGTGIHVDGCTVDHAASWPFPPFPLVVVRRTDTEVDNE